jgi:hypothetical protein
MPPPSVDGDPRRRAIGRTGQSFSQDSPPPRSPHGWAGLPCAVAPQRATGNIKVDGFGVTIDADARRLDFPHAGIDALRGEAGAIEYRAREVVFEALRASLQRVQWSTDAASAGDFVVRDKQGRFELKIARVELPHGVMLAQAAGGGVELVAPHASLADMRLKLPDLGAFHLPASSDPPPRPPSGPPPLAPAAGCASSTPSTASWRSG